MVDQNPNPNEPLNEDEQLLIDDHNYDGIQEYDNPIPGWWKWLFIATVVFSPLYILWFHAPGQNRDLLAQYESAYAANLEKKFGEIGELEGDADTILKFMNDKEWYAFGKNAYTTNCVTCHGANGEGISGPNLTDEYYINVKKIEDIASVIHNGAKAGAMPAFNTRLHPNTIVLTSSYIASLRGRNLPGRAPEGEQIAPWPTVSAEAEPAE